MEEVQEDASSVGLIMGSKFLFFQAEDGIRDLVRSRGLGDVYKRQVPPFTSTKTLTGHTLAAAGALEAVIALQCLRMGPVSYTHLTLPTSALV